MKATNAQRDGQSVDNGEQTHDPIKSAHKKTVYNNYSVINLTVIIT